MCSGTEDDISFDADYRLTKHFDAYAGVMYTGVKNGLANGTTCIPPISRRRPAFDSSLIGGKFQPRDP
jgi:predicted porin